MREYPGHAIAAVGAVVVVDGNIILVKRGYPPAKDRWSIPGGVIEAGEKVFDAARRELYEETGITANPLGIILIVNDVVRDVQSNVRYHYLILDVLFDSRNIKGIPRAGGDAVDVAWIPLEEALKRNDVSRTTKQLINELIKGRYYLLQVEEMEFIST
ncbi:MAG: NUDIX domain-containing protein [Ignisphaera sp.]|uniref:NUDIX domain-containing protein n=2 Tax=Ignisphaera aggregans TaxID=334771 RepID=A0A7J3JMT5_9CREN